MTDHIIKAAREAGQHADAEYRRAWEAGDGASWQQIRDAHFYAIAFKAGMERAAEICEATQDTTEEKRANQRFKDALKDFDSQKATERNAVDRGDHWMCVSTCNAVLRNAAKAIRAHAQNQPESIHDTGNV